MLVQPVLELTYFGCNMIDFMIDFESLGRAPEGVVVDCSIIAFRHDPEIVPSFLDLVNSGEQYKISIDSQKGRRIVDRSTVQFWKEQSPEAQMVLKPSPRDIDVMQLPSLLQSYLDRNGFDKKFGQGWCRGQSFDFPMYVSILRMVEGTRECMEKELCWFWNQRDVRTAIEATLLKRGMTKCPLPEGTLDGFIHHNSLHDSAKAILELIYSKRYALGLEEFPEKIDVNSK